jgi:hypothetical protein
MVLQEYGGHQVLGYDQNPGRVEDLRTLYLNNTHLLPDPELRYLLREARPLPLAPTLRSMVRYTDLIYFMVPPLSDVSAVDLAVDQTVAQIDSDEQRTLVLGRRIAVGGSRRLLGSHRHPWAYHPITGPKDNLVIGLTTPTAINVGCDPDPTTKAQMVAVWTPVTNTAPMLIASPEHIEMQEWSK